MLNYIWPIGLVIISNTFYQICAKSVPNEMNPFAALTITYAVGTLISCILYYTLNRNANLVQEFGHLNWAPLVMGIIIVGLEVGYIYAYKVGWPVSIAQIVQASVLAGILIFVGYFLFKESITWNKIAGIVICLLGLGLINMSK